MEALDDLLDEIRACRRCLEDPEGAPLAHEPRPVLRANKGARIVIAGQAPGTRVHQSGIPFTDPSGDRLRDWMGIDHDTFYDETKIAIVPMGFCFPGLDAKGGDLPPRSECAPMWRQRLFAHFDRLELMLLIGQYAQAWHLGAERKSSLTETVKNWRGLAVEGRAPRRLPLPHPSWRNNGWLKKNPWFEAELVPVLRAEVAQLVA